MREEKNKNKDKLYIYGLKELKLRAIWSVRTVY